jgi:predicted DCC family thiol-disulfide oxidoreductase YuxK
MDTELPEVEVFFDGACPLCRREIAFVRRLDSDARVQFTDIASPDFDAPSAVGRTHEDLMARIHARLPNGELVEGVEAFRRMYAAAGLPRAVALTRLPVVSHALEAGYRWFAANRLRLTGRSCEDGTCSVPPAKALG